MIKVFLDILKLTRSPFHLQTPTLSAAKCKEILNLIKND